MVLTYVFPHVCCCSSQNDNSVKVSKFAASDDFEMDLMMDKTEDISTADKETLQRHLTLNSFAHVNACLFFNPNDLLAPPPEWRVREINPLRVAELEASAIKNPAQVFAAPIQAIVIMRKSSTLAFRSRCVLIVWLFGFCQMMELFTFAC